jgi:hypothetical protein
MGTELTGRKPQPARRFSTTIFTLKSLLRDGVTPHQKKPYRKQIAIRPLVDYLEEDEQSARYIF